MMNEMNRILLITKMQKVGSILDNGEKEIYRSIYDLTGGILGISHHELPFPSTTVGLITELSFTTDTLGAVASLHLDEE
jgi:hypothetical protein